MNEDPSDREVDTEQVDYVEPEKIHPGALAGSLGRLHLLGDDAFLRMQATNVGMVDVLLMRMEKQIRATLCDDRPDMEIGFLLSALTQMWIFAVYELLRTWRVRANTALKLLREGKLTKRIEELESEKEPEHIGRKMLASQYRQALNNPKIEKELEEHLRRIFIPFVRLDSLRVTLAKHEVKGNRGSIAVAPGYGRFNFSCGAIEYPMGRDDAIVGFINRRDVADDFRGIWENDAPKDGDIASFKAFLKGPPEPPFGDPGQ